MRSAACCLLMAVALVLIPYAGSARAADEKSQPTCIQCHGGMQGKLGAPVKDWTGSVHARNGISCHDCHGGDPTIMSMEAMSPDKGFRGAPEYDQVPEFCGRCHVGVLDDYKQSAHGMAIDKGGAQCVVCHGNHAVQEANINLINEQDCSRCHEYGRAAEIKLALKETDAEISSISDELQRIHKLGFTTKSMEGTLFNLRNQFHRVFHSVDVQRVRQETGSVQAELGKMNTKIKEIDTTLGKRKLWGSVVIALLILLGVVFLLVRKTYEEEEKA